MLSSQLITSCFPLITLGEGEAKTWIIKPSSSPRVYGICRKRIMGEHLVALLAKIFKFTAVTGGCPKIWKRSRSIFIPKTSKAYVEQMVGNQ
jgi:hypothetical protein